MHGDLMVETDDGFEEVTFDKGLPVSVSDSEIPLERADGETVVLELTDETRWRGVDGPDELDADRPAIAFSSDGTARAVLQRPDDAPGPARPGPGPRFGGGLGAFGEPAIGT